ncbi:PRC-barrel domain protein [Posidoniimonas polymericola]|uniref:PRC-barrel domain protein n=1 Tax=Posidoniimonas polymericola TaxID=2528002 RepID=A0A5C5ZE02_9BACT|nr:PRC-barrel domain-containing protein [Posidoniimonas polymericola]TWT85649.1 PRC-barrel domain protein [Posidoniimonas polymericola]
MTIKKWTTGILATVLGVALCATSANAQTQAQQDARQHQSGQQHAAQQRTANYGADASKLDQSSSGHTVRASSLIGKAIENPAEENVGEVSDIVLDARTGKIQYVAVTYGGFLGMGNKMFAVPYQAFKVTPDPDDANDPNDYVLVLDVTQEKLEGAEGFDEDHWPSATDPQFTRQMNERYGVKHQDDRRMNDRRSNATGAVNRNVNPNNQR